jgi:hypothetical protein
MCAPNCAQLASTRIGWANKAKGIVVDTARLVEVESKFQFSPQRGLSFPRLGPFLRALAKGGMPDERLVRYYENVRQQVEADRAGNHKFMMNPTVQQ